MAPQKGGLPQRAAASAEPAQGERKGIPVQCADLAENVAPATFMYALFGAREERISLENKGIEGWHGRCHIRALIGPITWK